MYLHKSERQPKVRLVVLASTVIDARSNLISLVHRSSTDRPLLITQPTEYVCFERQGESASSRCVRFSRDARNLRATLRIRAWIERKCFRSVGDVTDHRDARLRNIAKCLRSVSPRKVSAIYSSAAYQFRGKRSIHDFEARSTFERSWAQTRGSTIRYANGNVNPAALSQP